MSEEKDTDPQLGRSYLVDPALVAIIKTAEALDKRGEQGESYLSLIVGGNIIFGRVVGHIRWADAVRDEDNESQEAQPSSADTVLPTAEAEEGGNDEDRQEDKPEDPERRFIHLLDARMVMGGRFVPSEGPGMAWRIRLAAVDGFSLAILGSRKDRKEGDEVTGEQTGPRTITVGNVRVTVT